jgi:hypothetical protein
MPLIPPPALPSTSSTAAPILLGTWLSDLVRQVPLGDRWLVEGLFARGVITALSARAKDGKSTLLAHLFRAIEKGEPFCSRTVRKARIFLVSEENSDIWIDRRETLTFGSHVRCHCLPFRGKPKPAEWLAYLQYLEAGLTSLSDLPWLVVFDTLSHLWPTCNENDNSEVARHLMPLRNLSAAGHGVCLVHHNDKAGLGYRGASEFAGFPDILLDFRRLPEAGPLDRRRVVTGEGRFNEIPKRLILELSPDHTRYVLAEGAAAEAVSIPDTIAALLPPAGADGSSAENLLAAWPANMTKPELQSIRNALSDGLKAIPPKWQESGKRKKAMLYTCMP